MREFILLGMGIAAVAIFRPEVFYETEAKASHIICRDLLREYESCMKIAMDSFKYGTALATPEAVIEMYDQGDRCRLQGYDVFDEDEGRCRKLPGAPPKRDSESARPEVRS